MLRRMQSAGGVIIGDEVLSGEVTDRNTACLIQKLGGSALQLRCVTIIRDEIETIGETVADHASRFDYVFTSGGLGPTHDDLTVRAVAGRFGVELVQHPVLVNKLQRALGDRINEAALRMAVVPCGTQVIEDTQFPILRFRNIFLLPGVPSIFAAKMESLVDQFGASRRRSRRLYLKVGESDFADTLAHIAEQSLPVTIGSYPTSESSGYRVMVVVRGLDAISVDSVISRLVEVLEPHWIASVEPALET